MKKIRLSSTIIVLVLVAVFFVSCSKNNSSHIPKNAFVVAVIDGKGLKDLTNNDFLKDNEEYKQTMESLKQVSEKLVELIEKTQKNPDELGLLFTKRSYAFASYDKEELLYGFIIPIDKKKLEANLDLIGTELGFPISAVLSTKDEIKYFADSDMILGWNKDVFIFLGKESGEVDFELLEKHFNLKKDESILANDDFKKFHKNCKDLNLWISSDIIKNVEEFDSEIKEFETLTGIDLANNYGHMHLEFAKGQINITSSFRYNKSIQELDIKKLNENSETLEKFFNKYLNLFNPVNYDNPYGAYTPNVGIGSNYGLVANGPIQDFGTGMFMAEEGGRLPQMQRAGIVSDKTVDPNRKKTVDVSNKKETFQNINTPLIGKTYYFNGKPYVYNPKAKEGRKLVFIASDPDNDIKQLDVDIVDFNKALNKDQTVNNYYQKYYSYDNKPDLSKFKLERYYVSDNEENAKSYEDPDFYTFTGKDSKYKVPYRKISYNLQDNMHGVTQKDDKLYYLKNNMNRVIQKDDKLYYLYSSFLDDIFYFEEEPQYTKRFGRYVFWKARDSDWYKVGFKSVPKVYAIPLDSNYEPIYDKAKIFDENDLRNARLAHNPFAEKEEEIVKEEPTNTNKTTTITQSSSKNNTSGKSTTQKKNDIMYNPKWERARF